MKEFIIQGAAGITLLWEKLIKTKPSKFGHFICTIQEHKQCHFRICSINNFILTQSAALIIKALVEPISVG